MLASGEVDSARQSVHAAEPVLALYFAAAQAVQFPPSGPVYPMIQVQVLLPAIDPEKAKQPKHVVEATVVEYVAAAQLVHATLP